MIEVLLPGPEINPQRDKVTEGTRVRCYWIVTAGVVPGTDIDELTKRWVLSSETFYREQEMPEADFKKEFPDGRSTFARFRDEAHEYAKELNDPSVVNWVNAQFMWM